MQVLVTGGAGFIGSHLVEYHLNQGDTVHVLDDLSTGSQANCDRYQDNPNFIFTKADILTYPDFETVVCWADRIYHMAAVVGVLRVINDSEKLLATNITATERLLQAAKHSIRKPRILLASTSEVYGDSDRPSSEKDNLIIGQGKKSCSAYSVSKIALEYFGLAYYEHFGLSVTIVRIFNMIGPRQVSMYGMVVPRFINYALSQEPILVHGTGEQTRSFCDVRDGVAIMAKLVTTDQAIGEIVNIGQDQEISINHLAHLVKKLAHSASEIKHIPYSQVYGEGFCDVMYRRPKLTKLHELINYEYQWNLQTTLTDLM